MRFLFIVQGEGRGHFTQAIALRNMLVKNGHEVVAVLVGKSKTRQIPSFFTDKIKSDVFSFESPNFLPSASNKKPRLLKSVTYNALHTPRYFRSMQFINEKIKELQPDNVINFYELLGSLTFSVFRPEVPLTCIGHQYIFTHPDYVSISKKSLSYHAMIFYTKATAFSADKLLALSFYDKKDVGKIKVVPPLLRDEVAQLQVTDGDYIHGYILNTGFAEEVIQSHKCNPETSMHFFWDKKDAKEIEKITPGMYFHALNDTLFLDYMAGSKAYATTSGFESVCEALYLGKPVLMVPTHIEQECNAHDAMKVGAGVVSENFDIQKLLDFIPQYNPDINFNYWVNSSEQKVIYNLTQKAVFQKERNVWKKFPKFTFPELLSKKWLLQ